MPLQAVLPALVAPMSLAEAKNHLRLDVDMTDDDALVAGHLGAVTDFAVTATQLQLVAARYRWVQDAFPGPSEFGVPYGVAYSLPGHAIYLPLAPVLQVVSITYTAPDGSTQTMPPVNYIAELTSRPARITPVFGQIWPITLPQIGAVQVTFDAGLASPVTIASGTPGTVAPALWPALAVGAAVQISNSGGALPAPLSATQIYYVQSVVSAGVYALATSVGGAAIAITDAGSGQNYIGAVPEGLKAWMKMRLGALYENREEALIANRGHLEEMPFLDSMLDPYRMAYY